MARIPLLAAWERLAEVKVRPVQPYRQDVGELGIAEVGDDLGGGRGNDGAQAEGAHGPLQVAVPARALQRQALAQRRLVHLHCVQGKAGFILEPHTYMHPKQACKTWVSREPIISIGLEF